MDKILRLYIYVDGGANDTPFPNADNPIEIGAFRYDAKRMGGAPTITASVNYASCLDDEWTENVYAMFNGEKFYLKQIPTSSYNNTSAMYRHDIELVSERIALDNVYFFDVVSDDVVDDDKPVSNSTKVVFFGDVIEFANRLKASLEYSALDYDVVVDAGVASEEKLISFEDQFFSNVLQEIYNTYEVPYYFEGKTIHIGYSKPNEELPSFAYGVDDALLSISKNNANYKVVNRATGTGSSENIPFYYPNNSPKGNIRAELNTASDDFSIEAVDLPTFSNKIDLEGVIEAKMVSLSVSSFMLNDEEYTLNHMPQAHIIVNSYQIYRDNVAFVAYSSSAVKGKFAFTIRISQDASEYMAKIHVGDKTLDPVSVVDDKINFEIEVNFEKAGNKEILAEVALSYIPQGHSSIRRAYNVVAGSGLGWFYKDKAIDLKDVGIKYQGTPSEGDKITQKLIEYINTSQSLMPSKYRDTKGVERFYNATNEIYPFKFVDGYELKEGEYVGEDGMVHHPDYYEYNNPFVAGKPKEHIVKIEDIKPSIEGMLVNGQRIDMFEAFAYDVDDNDETYEDEDGSVYFKHPYFFAKLKPLGFNLFDHAIEQQPMTISFTSGACGACNFEIAVDEESQKNTVQVTEDGSLVYDENGRVLCGVEGSEQGEVQPQDIQQDTTSHSVWIALRKEEATYGILMPKAPANGSGGHRPTTDDTFVILGINLPDEYILNAERRLEAEIIKYLQDNNDEKFTFSIGFSRIYFAENEDVLNSLNENSKIQITYDNKTYDLYVSSFSYTMSEGDALPEIKVELDETLKTSQNAIQKAINEVKTTLGSAINEVSQGVAMQRRSYVSKVQDDTAMGVVDFSKGVKFGEGGKVEILDNNSAKLTIEYLEVTKKATFTSLEIQEKTHVGGQMLVTPASMNCGEVEEFEGFYRCYFQTKGADGSEEIFNQFAVGDQAICQTFNAWGSKYYWRLVVGVGEDYIDLSKEDCDEGSGVPEAGDRIIQMGNRDNADRQNAIVIAAHGDNSPYIVQYKGINNFDLPNSEDDERITTLLSPTRNVLTGQVRMTAGSSGLENFLEWQGVENTIASMAYIQKAIQNGDTIVTGGLIQSGILMLGYVDENGVYHVMSGTNGVYDESATGGGIAAWYGGAMSEDTAKIVLRFDGSGFFANKNITWDNEGGASFAGGKITITKEGALTFSDTIAFGSGGDSVSTVLEKLSTLLSYFTLEGNELSTNYQVRIKNNLIVEQDTSSGGEGQDTPSAGLDEEQLQNYLDLHKYVTESRVQEMIDEVAAGDVDLTNYYTKQEVDAKIAQIDLSEYATKSDVSGEILDLSTQLKDWVEEKQYASESDVSSLREEVETIYETLGLSETAEGYINTWNEVVAFLDGFDKDNPDLAEILQGMDAEIAKKVDKTLFDSLAATVTQHNTDIGTLKTDMTTAKDNISSLSTLASTNKTDIGKLDTRLKTAEGEIDTLQTYTNWLDSVKGLIYKDGDNIKINTSLIVVGDTSSGGSGEDTPASGTVTGIKVSATHTLEPNTAGIIDMVDTLASIDVSDQLTAYAKTADVNSALALKQDTISDLATIRSGAALGATALQSITKSMVDSVLGGTTSSNANKFLMCTGSTTVWSAVTKSMVASALGASTGGRYLIDTGGDVSWGTIPTKLSQFTDDVVSGKYLPLSGGRINGVLKLNGNNQTNVPLNISTPGMGNTGYIRFGAGESTNDLGYIGFSAKGVPAMIYEGVVNTLIHSGNIAAQLDSRYFRSNYSSLPTDKDLATLPVGSYWVYENKGLSNQVPITYSSLVVLGNSYYAPQLSVIHNASRAWLRGIYNVESGSTASEWHELAFVDSNITGKSADSDKLGGFDASVYPTFENQGTVIGFNLHADYIKLGQGDGLIEFYDGGWYNSMWGKVTAVNGFVGNLSGNASSATKLQTARTLWGQSFDGTGNVSGHLSLGTYAIKGPQGNALEAPSYTVVGYGTCAAGYDTYIDGKNIYLRSSTSHNEVLTINSSGNVTIGASDLAGTGFRLRVAGSTYLEAYNGNSTYVRIGASNAFGLHVEARGNGNTYFQSRRFDATTAYYNIVLQELGGNVGIGTTSPAYKLDVAGTGRFTGDVTINGNLVVSGDVASA